VCLKRRLARLEACARPAAPDALPLFRAIVRRALAPYPAARALAEAVLASRPPGGDPAAALAQALRAHVEARVALAEALRAEAEVTAAGRNLPARPGKAASRSMNFR
jgi:hypothetical protein